MNAPVRFQWQWAALLVLVAASSAVGQTPDSPVPPATGAASPSPTGAPPAAGAAPPNLATSQDAISQRYRRFEETLTQLSEYLRKTDPQRAELLTRAIGKSQQGRVHDQLRALTEILKNDQLGDAIEREEEVIAHMQAVLELLMSEDRRDEIEKERARIKDLIKDVDKLISRQTDVRTATERGQDSADLERDQQRLAEGSQKLVDKIDGQDAQRKSERQSGDPKSGDPKSGDPKSGDPKSGDPKSGDPKSGDPKSGDPKSGDPKSGDPKSGDPKSGDPKSGDPKSGDPKSGKPQSGKPQSGKPQSEPPQDMPPDDSADQPQGDENQSEDAQDPDKTPGRDDIQRAKEQMDRAIEELKRKQRSKASDKQDQALANLLKAREKLEEILRQLREEERAMVLAALEARFRDMLQRQEVVNHGTLAIHTVPEAKRTDRHRNRAVELARNEDEIVLLAEKALTLLHEEGSSVAFPEAVEQIRDDMLTVSRRLERTDVGEITQSIEADIVESLKEMLEALQKELEKLKDKNQQGQQQQQQQQQQQERLVNKLAELKMLRSLQYRVNRRTKQMGRLIDGEQALDMDVVSQLRQLSDRQSRVQQATHDLATGRNE